MVSKKVSIFLLPFFFLMESVRAHCPLCTIGAAAAAGGAAYMGVDKAIIGLFIGGFAVSTGWWMARLLKKKYIPFQKWAIILASFALTVYPLLSIMGRVEPMFISLAGGYGTLLNRTYLVNISLVASILGGLIVSVAPGLSKKISGLRGGKVYPFQGIILTLTMLIVAAFAIQWGL